MKWIRCVGPRAYGGNSTEKQPPVNESGRLVVGLSACHVNPNPTKEEHGVEAEAEADEARVDTQS